MDPKDFRELAASVRNDATPQINVERYVKRFEELKLEEALLSDEGMYNVSMLGTDADLSPITQRATFISSRLTIAHDPSNAAYLGLEPEEFGTS